MASDTPPSCRSLVLYEVYVRNHGPNGTFGDVEADLPRVKALGVDVVWFRPIHPVGRVQRKRAAWAAPTRLPTTVASTPSTALAPILPAWSSGPMPWIAG